jgi:hypothetical protein
MRRADRGDCLFRGVDKAVGALALLLLGGLGLEVYATLTGPEVGMASRLLALYAGTWLGILGMTGLAVIPLVVFARARSTCR